MAVLESSIPASFPSSISSSLRHLMMSFPSLVRNPPNDFIDLTGNSPVVIDLTTEEAEEYIRQLEADQPVVKPVVKAEKRKLSEAVDDAADHPVEHKRRRKDNVHEASEAEREDSKADSEADSEAEGEYSEDEDYDINDFDRLSDAGLSRDKALEFAKRMRPLGQLEVHFLIPEIERLEEIFNQKERELTADELDELSRQIDEAAAEVDESASEGEGKSEGEGESD